MKNLKKDIIVTQIIFIKLTRIKNRILIVGTARSGTTLLQNILSNNDELYTFPETHFFEKTIIRRPYLRFLHYSSDKKIKYVNEFLSKINSEQCYTKYNANRFSLNKWVEYLIKTIDCLCLKNNKSIWIEKTPLHLYYTDSIYKVYPNTKYIHIIRNPVDNIAALYDVSKKYPNSFNQNTLKKAFNAYHKDLTKHIQVYGKDNHFFITYDKLVELPTSCIKEVCDFIEIDYNQEMLKSTKRLHNIMFEEEKWKSNNKNEIIKKTKIEDRLTSDEIKWLNKQVSSYDFLSFLDKI